MLNLDSGSSFTKKLFGSLKGLAFATSVFLVGIYFSKILCICGYLPSINSFPDFTIAAFGTLLTVFLTITTLTFNLGSRLPEDIINKYIRNHQFTWFYFSSIVVSLLISIFGFYNFDSIFSYYSLTLSLSVSVLLTAIFFYWFIKRTNKEGIYSILKRDIEKEISGKNEELDLDKGLESRGQKIVAEFGKRPQREVGYVEARESEGDSIQGDVPADNASVETLTWGSDREGVLNLDAENLNQLYTSLSDEDSIVSLEIIGDDYYVNEAEEILRLEVVNDSKKSIEDRFEIKQVFSISEENFEAFEDWLSCMHHSRNNNPKRLKKDFKVLKEIMEASYTKGRSKKIFRSLQKEIGKNADSTEIVLGQTIDLIYKIRAEKSISPETPPRKQDLLTSQQTLAHLFREYEGQMEGYSNRYEKAILHMNEMINYDFKMEFDKSDDKYNDDYYDILINSIDASRKIIDVTLEHSFKQPTFYNRYLRHQLQHFVKTLEPYRSIDYREGLNSNE